MAALFLNGDAVVCKATVHLHELGLDEKTTYEARDVYARKTIGTVGSEGYSTGAIAVHDSQVVTFTPTKLY